LKVSLNAALACHQNGEYDAALSYIERCAKEHGGAFPKLEKIRQAVLAAKSGQAVTMWRGDATRNPAAAIGGRGMQIVQGLTQHTVVLCVDKRERALVLQALLSKTGLKPLLAFSLYEALRLIPQEMPHLIGSEALLADGTAGILYNRLQQDSSLSRIPILVRILRKTREELTAVAKRQFAGVFLGATEPQTFVAKINEVLAARGHVSPYFVDTDTLGLDARAVVAMDAVAVGRSGEHVVLRSATEVDAESSLLCVPKKAQFAPLSRIVGRGRLWLAGLPEIDAKARSGSTGARRTVLLYEPNAARFEQFKAILHGYDIEATHAKTLHQAASMVQARAGDFGCVFLHELVSDASSLAWRDAYNKLPAASRPPLLIGTSAVNARATASARYIRRPFGLGLFIEMREATCARAEDVADTASAASEVPIRYEAPVKLLGVDETGGVLQLHAPLLKGSRMRFVHPSMNELWGDTDIEITAVAPTSKAAVSWQARFETVAAGTSKAKYWEKVTSHLDGLAQLRKEAVGHERNDGVPQ